MKKLVMIMLMLAPIVAFSVHRHFGIHIMKIRMVMSIFFFASMGAGVAQASGMDRSYCIDFEPGFATNSCGMDLDVTWCESESYSTCTASWKSSYVRAQGRSTVSFDRADQGKIILKFACDKDDNDCFKARNNYSASKGG